MRGDVYALLLIVHDINRFCKGSSVCGPSPREKTSLSFPKLLFQEIFLLKKPLNVPYWNRWLPDWSRKLLALEGWSCWP